MVLSEHIRNSAAPIMNTIITINATAAVPPQLRHLK